MREALLLIGALASGTSGLAAEGTSGLAAESEGQNQSELRYEITGEAAMGSGDFTAYQLVSNRYHALSTRANTGYLRAALFGHKYLGHADQWLLSGGADVIASVHADHSVYLQQLYARLQWEQFYLEAGSREHAPVLRNRELSSGSLVQSGNAKPIPQLRLGTDGFWTVPGLGDWLQVYFDASYGHFMDDDWLEKRFDLYHSQHMGSFVTTEVWSHEKKLYLRTDPHRRFSFAIGMEHGVQFGGHKASYESGELKITDTNPDFADFFKVILPQSDGSPTTNAGDSFVFGNHVGSWNLQLDWNIDQDHQLSCYHESPFEDGSGIRKGNRYDGLYGVEYRRRGDGISAVRGVVLEFLQTTDQSGSIHWAPQDFEQSIIDKLPSHATGNDNYYNNFYYNGYAHYGMALGNPLLKSPIYNLDGYLGFTDNRIRAWHMAISGDVTSQIDYLVKGSYREGYGTYFVPLDTRHHSLDLMAQCRYRRGAWHYSAAFGLSQGNILGNCTSFDFKVTYYGKIL